MSARDKDKLAEMAVFYAAIICGSLAAGWWIFAGLAALQWAFITLGLASQWYLRAKVR